MEEIVDAMLTVQNKVSDLGYRCSCERQFVVMKHETRLSRQHLADFDFLRSELSRMNHAP